MLHWYVVALERARAGGRRGGREREGGGRLRVYTRRRMLKGYIFFSRKRGRERGRE
jgi:hypothetical protein